MLGGGGGGVLGWGGSRYQVIFVTPSQQHVRPIYHRISCLILLIIIMM